jgi:hypothetical protein
MQTHVGKMNRKQFLLLVLFVRIAGLSVYRKQRGGGTTSLGKSSA